MNRSAVRFCSRALQLLAVGNATALAVTRLDRLTRSVVDLSRLMAMANDQQWALVIIDLGVDTTTASGKLVANVMGAIAEWERDVISERTKAALGVKRSPRVRLGGPIRVPEEIRQRIARERIFGSTYRSIEEGLEVDHVPIVGGGSWRTSTVADVCKSVALYVCRHHGREAQSSY